MTRKAVFGSARTCTLSFASCLGSKRQGAAPGAPDRHLPSGLPGAPDRHLPSGHHGCRLRLAHPSSPSPMAAAKNRPATVLVVNTLTSKPGEAPHAFLQRNGLATDLLQNMPLSLFPECGVPQADRNDRFNGVTFALLKLEVPEGQDVPLKHGLEFAPSRGCRLPGEAFNTRFFARRARETLNSPGRSQRLAQVGPCH